MPYATAADIETRLGADAYLVLADRAGVGAANVDEVDAALVEASSVADSYLARWLPLPSVPKAVARAVIDIAVHELAGDRETENQRQRYEDAIAWLRDIAAGKASLGLPTEAPAAVGDVIVEAPPREMSRRSLRGVI